MLKVLIADDEKKICQLIANLIDWKGMGIEIAGIVNDGISAYKFLQKNPIDILITDIRMPGCDGMELIEKAQFVCPDLHIIIISGYSQFEYARQAIRFGVEDYLLKPIQKKDLRTTLIKILEKHNEEIQDVQKWNDVQKRLEENEKKVKKGFLEDVLKRPEKFTGSYTISKINEEYHYKFNDTLYQALIVKVIKGKTGENVNARRILLEKSMKHLNENLEKCCNEIVLNIIDDEICGVFNSNSDELDRAKGLLKKVRLDISRLEDVFEGVEVYMAVGKKKNNLNELLDSFKEARNAMQNRFCYNGKSVLEEVEGIDVKDVINSLVDNSVKKRFLNYIEIIDIDNICKEIDEIENLLCNITEKDGRIVIGVYKEILSLFYFSVYNYNINIPEKYSELMHLIEYYGSTSELMGILKEHIRTSLLHWIKEKKDNEIRPIRLAKRYISENYYKALTLEMVSREIGFNPTYFSSIFKKETGMNFLDYLKNIRVENAKNMLLNTNETVEDISIAVGYSDIKYFSRVFKNLTGITPTEFRKLYN